MRRIEWSCLLALTFIASTAMAQERRAARPAASKSARWPLGTKVVAKRDRLPLLVKGTVVATAPLGVIWQVRERRGEWLWLGRGWARQDDLVPLSEAADYFAREIQRASNPAAYVARCLGFLEDGQALAALADAQSALGLDHRFAAAYVARSQVFAADHDWDRALEDLDDAIRLAPTEATYYCLRGQLLERRKRPHKAVRDFERALDLDPGLAAAHSQWAAIFLAAGDDKRALAECEAALLHDATDSLAHHTRGQCWFNSGEYTRAIASLNEAIRHDPGLAAAYVDRGRCHARLGALADALADFNISIRLDDKSAEAYEGRAYAHYLLGDFDEALADRTTAQKLRPTPADNQTATATNAAQPAGQQPAGQPVVGQVPNAPAADAPAWANLFSAPAANPTANNTMPATVESGQARRTEAAKANNAAWRAATSTDERYRNGDRAIEFAERACNLSDWKSAEYLDTLAAAYAEAGDFEHAIEWEQKSMELAPERAALQKGARERLELYRAGKPYHEERSR